MLNGKTFSDKKAAAKFVSDILAEHKNSLQSLSGEYKGLKFRVAMSDLFKEEFILSGKFPLKRNVSQIPGDNINRIIDMVDKLPQFVIEKQAYVDSIQGKIDAANLELSSPFPQQEEFDKLSLRSAELAAKLNLDKDNSEQQIDIEKNRRLDNIFSVEPANLCEKKFFAIVKHAVQVNKGVYSQRSELLAIKKLKESGFSNSLIVDTLAKFSPIVSDKEDLKKVVSKKSPVR